MSAGPAAEGAEDPGMEGDYRRQQPGEDGEISIKQAHLVQAHPVMAAFWNSR